MKLFSFWENSTAMRILLFFIENPTGKFYASRISDLANISVGSASKHLPRLSEENLINSEKIGRMTFYSLNRENIVVKRLKIAYNVSKPIVRKLMRIGKELRASIFIYGSVARGEDTEQSDWDILVVGRVRMVDFKNEIGNTKEKMNISIYTLSEWNKMKKKDPAFYERVERDKLKVI